MVEYSDGPEYPRRVLYVDHHDGFAGGQRSLLVLLSKLSRSEFQPYVACDARDGDFRRALKDTDCNVIPIAMNRSDSRHVAESDIHQRPLGMFLGAPTVARAVWQLRNVVSSYSIDLLYANSFKAGALCSLVSRSCGIPLIFRARTSRQYSNHGWIDRFICASSHVVFANSEYVAEGFRPITRDPDKIVKIYNPLEEVRGCESAAENAKRMLRKKYQLRPDSPVIGLVGRISERKRPLDLVKAAPEILRRFPDATFLLIGEPDMVDHGEYASRVQRAVEQLGLADRVKFTGFLSEITTVIQGLDALVLPSVAEPLARAIIEAMSVGVPVVASDSGGNQEIVESEHNGLLFKTGDPLHLASQLLRVLEDSHFASQLGESGRKFVQESFSDDATVGREEQWYRSLCESRTSAA